MKKNFSVNIGGRIFHIDEDAYERLSNYLSSLRKYFSKEEGCDEIISDIEGRIAELLEQKKAAGSQVIPLDLADEVIREMGEPAEFFGGESTSTPPTPTRTRGKLYRDPDGRFIGGVASGIAAYFGINTIWIRLLFAGFIFLYFSGAIVYLILWLILPEARTIPERLEMQRRTINLDNLRNEISNTGIGIRKTGNSVLGFIGNFLRFCTEVVTHVFRLLIQVLRIASGVFLLGLVILLFVGVMLAFIDRDTFHMGMYHLDTTTFYNMLAWYVPGPSIRWLAYLSFTLLALGVAGVFIYMGLRLIFRWPPLRWQVLGLFGLLVVGGMVTGGGALYQFSRSTQERATASQVQTYPQRLEFLHLTLANSDPGRFWKPLVDTVTSPGTRQVLGNTRFSVRPAPGDSLIVTCIREASAFREFQAEGYLNPMKYHYTLQDTLLTLEPYFSFPVIDGMHHQRIEVIIGIPLNTQVRLDENLAWDLHSGDIDGRRDAREEYIMTATGLKAKNPEAENVTP